MRHGISLFLFVGAIALSSCRALGHGSEFILAKVTTIDGLVRLELTASYGENPMLRGEAEAREALRHVLRVRLGDSSRELEELSAIRFVKRTEYEPDAPLPKEPSSTIPHQLLTALWQWAPRDGSVSFEVPKGNPHDVLLWKVNRRAPEVKPQWLLMIAGDYTPPIEIPRAIWWRRNRFGWARVILVGVLAPLSWLAGQRLAATKSKAGALSPQRHQTAAHRDSVS